jgi:hypothetical protein
MEEYEVAAPKVEKYTTAQKYYEIEAFNKETKEYDKDRMEAFLKGITPKYKDGDIVSVDGLKWQRFSGRGNVELAMFAPFPNPPIPVYEESKETKFEHIDEYRQWIIDHPHFGYPPLPPR